jgi:hypothetical protein
MICTHLGCSIPLSLFTGARTVTFFCVSMVVVIAQMSVTFTHMESPLGTPRPTQVCVNLPRDAADDLRALGVHYTTFDDRRSSHRHIFCVSMVVFRATFRYFHPHEVTPRCSPTTQVVVNVLAGMLLMNCAHLGCTMPI